MGKQKKNRQGADQTSKTSKTFQRKKVKVGKKLPKATNTTNTSFKTKTIQIIQQLKKDEDVPTTKRKVNIKELLSQSQHYNITMRLGAAKGLKELLLISKETVISSLGLVIDRAGSLMTDKDCHVRDAVLKLFKSIFEVVPASCMSPFFPILCAHLCCAMTHINGDIQEDSLSMFDCILDTYPKLIIQSSNQLLANFVEQISKQKFKYHKTEIESLKATNYTLSVTPNSRLSSQKWQTKVLTRLYKLLSIVLQPEKLNKDCQDVQENVFTSSQRILIPVQNFLKDQWSSPGFVIKASTTAPTSSGILEDISNVKILVVSLFPLMLQCWVEAHDSDKVEGSLLYRDAISIRTTCLQIAILLMEYGEKNSDSLDVPWKKWLSENYEELFKNHFLSCFPYQLHESKKSKKPKKKKQTQNVVSPDTLNLAVCNVLIKFIKCPKEFLLQQAWVSTIVKHVRDLIRSPDLSLDVRRHLLQVLNELIHLTRSGDRELLLDDCFYRYEQAHELSQEKLMFLDFFSSVVFAEKKNQKLSKPLAKFLQSLPDLLIKVKQSNTNISHKVVSVIKDGATTNCVQLIRKWQAKIDVLFNLEKGIFLKSSPHVQKSIIEIFYWLPDVSPSQLSVLSRSILSDKLDNDLGLYFIQVLHQRYLKSSKHGLDADKLSDHLCFLILTMSGPTDDTDGKLAMETDQQQMTFINWSKGGNSLHQMRINELVCSLVTADFEHCESLVKDIICSNLETKVKQGIKSKSCDISLVLNFLFAFEHFMDDKYTTEYFTDFLINVATDLALILNGSFQINVDTDLVQKLFTKLQNILLNKKFLDKFMQRTFDKVLSMSEETALINIVQMLAHLISQKCVQVSILELANKERLKYKNNLKKMVTFIEKKFARFISESWWSNLVYFLELLN